MDAKKLNDQPVPQSNKQVCTGVCFPDSWFFILSPDEGTEDRVPAAFFIF